MTTHEVLVKAREVIEDPDRWTTGAFGRMDGGQELETDTDDFAKATSFCALGACLRAAESEWVSEVEACDVLRAQLDLPHLVSVSAFNDSHSHAEVLALFDKAIAATAAAPDMSWLAEPAAEYLVS